MRELVALVSVLVLSRRLTYGADRCVDGGMYADRYSHPQGLTPTDCTHIRIHLKHAHAHTHAHTYPSAGGSRVKALRLRVSYTLDREVEVSRGRRGEPGLEG